MSASGPKSLPSVGFLTVVSGSEHGLFGGYLVLNAVGRPLEFHCTAPVRPNRAQEILFGATLEPFLYGEQIGQTLVGKSKLKPVFICTDLEAVTSMRPYVSYPVAWIPNGDSSGKGKVSDESRWKRFLLGGQEAAVSEDFTDDGPIIRKGWSGYENSLDLSEPFERIREATEEAQRGKRNAA